MGGRELRAAVNSVPRAAWICALVAFLNATAWSLIVPLFQVPDEQAHTGYAQYIAEVGKPPAGEKENPGLAEQERQLLDALGWHEVIHRPDSRPLITERVHRHLEEVVDTPADPKGKGGVTTATYNPPLYYAGAAAAYRISPATDLADRVHLMRLFSALLAGITALFLFLFLRELLPAQPWAWTIGALAVAFQPTVGFIGGGVSPDNLVIAATAALFFCIARAFRHGLTVPGGIAIGAASATAVLAKAPALGLVPGIVLGVALLVFQASPSKRGDALRGALAAAGTFAVPVLLYMLLNVTVWDRGIFFGAEPDPAVEALGPETTTSPTQETATLTGVISHYWQFYLPRLPGMEDAFAAYPLRDIIFNGSIGYFGWGDYRFPGWVYDAALPLVLLLLALAISELVACREVLRGRVGELATYAVLTLGLTMVIAWVGYHARTTGETGYEQARYFFPLLAAYAAVIALAARGAGRSLSWTSRASRSWGPVAGVVIVSIAIAHSVVAMLITLTRYYG